MFWLLACSSPWTREAALAPLVAHLDQNKDGKLDAAEYEREIGRAHV